MTIERNSTHGDYAKYRGGERRRVRRARIADKRAFLAI